MTFASLPHALEGIPRLCPRGLPDRAFIIERHITRRDRTRYDFHALLACIGGAEVPEAYEWVVGMFDRESGELSMIWRHDGDGVLRRSEPAQVRVARPGALMPVPS